MTRVRLGVSSCLLGRPVRFDGGHKRDAFLTETLESYVEWVPVCPEVGAGLPTPRPALRLVSKNDEIRMVTAADGADVTPEIRSFSQRRIAVLKEAGLDGYILKKDSPSCGLERVRIYDAGRGSPRRDGRGLFASALISAFPDLPIEEEGRLKDASLREAFFERVFAQSRMSTFASRGCAHADLVSFHSAHKFQLLSHSPELTRVAGRAVASAGPDARATAIRYGALFVRAMTFPATRGRNVNVLQHGLGFLKRLLRRPARTDLLNSVKEYELGLVPLIVPVSLLAHRARDEGVIYLLNQTYLDPYPRAMGLRNAV
jgi:uncharacterized protein YbbK (DUF523 family)/uncharacterized protein YbgA (DUF1722 family)